MSTGHSLVNTKIVNFIAQYGVEQLIEWLDEFDYMGGPVRFRKFKKVEKLACEAYGISIADMHTISKNECTDAKRIISYISLHVINLKQPVIAKLLGNVSLRSVGYYIKDAEGWIEKNPRANKTFYDNYQSVINKFNIE